MTIDLSSHGFRLSPQQRQIWISQQAYPDPPFRVVTAFTVAGDLDNERLRQSLALIVEKHEILRTNFVRPAGIKIPFQVISEKASFFWRVVDLKQLDEEQQRAQIDALFAAECNERSAFEDGPVVRAQLVETAERSGVLLLSLPALCADSQTPLNIVAEMFHAGLPAGEVAQYADFAEWQNQLLESDDEHALAGKSYWKNKHSASDSSPTLPHESIYPNEHAAEFEVVTVELDGELVNMPEALERETGTTVQDLLFVIWQSLISRLSGRRELTIYKRCDARQDEELRGALGPFEQYVPMRCVLESDDFERQVRSARAELNHAADALAYAPALDDALVSGKAIAFEYQEQSSLTAGAFTVSLAKQFVFSNPFKLKLSCTRSDDRLLLQLQYDRRILQQENCERLLDYLQTLIQAVATAMPAVRSDSSGSVQSSSFSVFAQDNSLKAELKPSALKLNQYRSGPKLDAIDILPATERHALLVQLNDTATEYNSEKCIHEFFEEQAGRTPSAVAVVCGDRQLSYDELNSRANQVAHLLIEMGVKPNTCVGMCLTRSVDSIVALLGILKTGAAYVPLNPEHPLARLRAQLQKSEAAVCLTNSNHPAQALEANVKTIDFDRDAELLLGQPATNTIVAVSSEALVYAIYTSGSTGTPKAVAVRHRNLVNYTEFILNRLRIEEPLQFATVSTISADLGNTCIFPALFSGGCLHLIEQDVSLESRRFSNYLRRHRIAVLKIAPSHLQALLSDGEQTALPSRYLILGGEAFPRQLLDLIRTTPHTCEIINHYGPTETTVGSLTFGVSDHEISGVARTVPIGRPIANTSAYILDKYMRLCPSGVAGELYIGGVGVAAGYLNDADQTAARFVPDPFCSDADRRLYRTGDWARVLPDGNIEFLGRIDSQVKVRGYRIELGEIEAVLNEHRLVRQAVVILRRDAGRERLVAYVTGPQLRAANADEISEFLKQQLPDYMLPSAIVVMRSFPTTANGKVDRDALPAEDSQTDKIVVAPQTITESELVRVWAELLKLEELSVHDDFFDLGGHSLLATQLVSRVRKTFNKDIPLRSIFDAPTIAKLAVVIERVTDNDQLDLQTELDLLESLSDDEAERLLNAEQGDRV